MQSGVKESFFSLRSRVRIVFEAVDLVHPLMQDRDDTDVTVREYSPVDEVPFVTEVVAFDAEVGRDGTGRGATGCDAVECFEQAGDVTVRLFGAPALARVAVDFVDPPGRRLLDEDLGHVLSPCCAR